MIKDKEFYNQESNRYSAKRYPEEASNYVQYFFKKRLELVLKYLRDVFANKKDLNIFEIGCADGVILRSVAEEIGGIFCEIVGVDTAEAMIAQARKISDQKISFFVRGDEPLKKFDVILEIGVINYADFEDELKSAKSKLKEGGTFVLSVAGKGSINGYFGQGAGYANYLPYKDYENIIKKHYTIEKIMSCGIFAPLIWRNKKIGKVMQNILEKIFIAFPNLYHEKIYILR